MTTTLTPQDIFTFQKRAADVRIDIATTAEPEDLADITFRAASGAIELSSLTAVSGGDGLLVDFTLSPTHLDLWPGSYRWDLIATVSASVHAVAFGWLIVDPEVTEESS